MVTNEQEHKIKEIFVYAENSRGKDDNYGYFNCLNTFLAFSSFCLNDNSLYPYWVSNINCNSIISVALLANEYSTSYSCNNRFIEDIMTFYVENNEKVWEFTDQFEIPQKEILLKAFLDLEYRQSFIKEQVFYERHAIAIGIPLSAYMGKLSNCNSFDKYVTSKYKLL